MQQFDDTVLKLMVSANALSAPVGRSRRPRPRCSEGTGNLVREMMIDPEYAGVFVVRLIFLAT